MLLACVRMEKLDGAIPQQKNDDEFWASQNKIQIHFEPIK